MKAAGGALAAVLLIPILLLVIFAGDGCGAVSSDGAEAAQTINVEDLPVDEIGDWSGDQLVNAAIIMNAAGDLGMPLKAQTIGVMTAMGESSLTNVKHGDKAGPDSVGLFQQRDNGAWGSYEDRTDPHTAATNFFEALAKVDGWEAMEPTLAANKVQGNQDPYHYEPYWDDATNVVSTLGDIEVSPGGTAAGCPAASGAGNGDYPSGVNPPGQWGGYENGRIPEQMLSPIPWASDQRLRGDATQALISLNEAYKAEFGHDLIINRGYRDYLGQVAAKEKYGSNAAQPGTSNHGWALAADFGGGMQSYGSADFAWMTKNAPSYGWRHPEWAAPFGIGPHEPWHWEFWGLEEE